MITKAISCNFCSSTYPTGGAGVNAFDCMANDFFRHAKARGWVFDSHDIHYCPSCAVLPEEHLYKFD